MKCKSAGGIGSGASAHIKDAKRGTAASLKLYQMKGKDNMNRTRRSTPSASKRKTQAPITAHEALQMLESAVSYCQQAGLNVSAANGDNGTLGLFIQGAFYVLTDNGTRAAFRLGALSAQDAPSIGTPGAGVSAQGAARIGTRAENVSVQAYRHNNGTPLAARRRRRSGR